jgi:hypothetical protein
MSRHELDGGGRLQAVDEVRCARVTGRGEDRAVICGKNVQPVGGVGGVVLARLKRQIKIGTEERGAEFGHEFFDRVAFGPETLGAKVARQARFVCGPAWSRERGWRSSSRKPANMWRLCRAAWSSERALTSS